MIANVKIGNLKRFSNTAFQFRPLTVLTGFNGSGKSTVIQSLLLVRQVAESSSEDPIVRLNGPYGLELGESIDVLHAEATTSEITIGLTGSSGKSALVKFEVPAESCLYLKADPGVSVLDELGSKGLGFSYLCAERLGPRDVLALDSVEPACLTIGVQGQYTAQVLSQFERQQIPKKRRFPNALPNLLKQTEAWLGYITRPIEVNALRIPEATISTLRFKLPGVQGDWMRPANLGFGISYVLPIIAAGLLVPQNGLLIVENPEAHLHPVGQSRLAIFLATVAASGSQVLVETHSDHIINGIRRAVGTERLLEPENVVIHFFGSDTPSHAPSNLIEIRRNGSLSEWPRGFFDQIEQDLGAIARSSSGIG